jgi:ATP-dependent Clp protease ATP-binding subunit ClpA
MLSNDLRVALGAASELAAKNNHEYLTVDHALFALLHDPSASRALVDCGGNLQEIEAQISEVLATYDRPDGEPNTSTEEGLVQTPAFRRVLHRAILHCQGSHRGPVRGGDILIAMFGEGESNAVYILLKQGVTRFNLIKYITHGERSDGTHVSDSQTPRGTETDESSATSDDPLAAYTTDLFARAEAGKIDPLIGRESEVARAIQVLGRRRKNNPLFVGEAGVGKTAIVEGIAKAVFDGLVPEALDGVRIYSLDLGALLAGTRYRGDFEERLKKVVNALQEDPKAVLFIDEIHTIVGAGATSGGTMDASNILKPALSSGDLRCIGSTTYDELRTSFGKDKALARRFQTIEVEEPSPEESKQILKGLQSRYEEHHGLKYDLDALDACVTLSVRHITGRQLPDKAIDLMDEVGSAVHLSGEELVQMTNVEATVAMMARIPPRSVSTEDRERLMHLDEDLRRVIFGQDEAIEAVVSAIKMSRAGISAANKPTGSFLFTGPTGVGKTELAKQLASALGVKFIRFDMSEYMEKHAVSRLIGAPPGYVGFEQGGQLTDAVHKNPHCVIVLDEIEKAHSDIYNVLLQVMDDASLTDNNGRKSSFKNVVLILTTNAGSKDGSLRSVGFGGDARGVKASNALKRVFPPEFRNRLDQIVSFAPLPEPVILKIVDKCMLELEQQLVERDVVIEASPAARDFFATEGYKPEFGAREMGRVIQEHIKRPLADLLLFGPLAKGGRALVDLVDGKISITAEAKTPPMLETSDLA